MTAQIAAYGRIGRDPRNIPTRTGKAMAAVSLAVEVPCRSEGDDGATLWLDVLAFGRVADDLMRHAKGDSVSVAGRLALNRYQATDGSERESWQCIADSAVSSRTVRPGGGRRSSPGADGPPCPRCGASWWRWRRSWRTSRRWCSGPSRVSPAQRMAGERTGRTDCRGLAPAQRC